MDWSIACRRTRGALLQSGAMTLTEAQKKFLRGKGHPLKPVIAIGNAGLTEGVLKEVITTIDHHELIKVKVRSADRELRDDVIADLCRKADAHLIKRIGNVALIYRRNADKSKLTLPG